jgi:hypothetical protein
VIAGAEQPPRRKSTPTKGSQQAVVGTFRDHGRARRRTETGSAQHASIVASVARSGGDEAACAIAAPDEAAEILAYRVAGRELARSGRVRRRTAIPPVPAVR